MNEFKIKTNFLGGKITLSLILIGISAISYRIFFGNFEVPVVSDSYNYFLYAMDIRINSQLPSNYSVGNNGWPIFLSSIFSIFEFNTVIEYMQTQKIVTIIISSLTIIPIFYLCKNFFNNKLSLIGPIIFAFEPRIVLNSSLGITEPIFVLLGTIVLTLFLSENKKLIYLSFIVSAFACMIRTEGIFVFFAISMIFLIRFRKDKMIILKYILVLTIFVLILLPMVNYRIETLGHDGLSQRIINGIEGHIYGSSEFSEKHLEEIGDNTEKTFFTNGIENYSKYLVWNLIPIFILFVPIGILFLFKNIDYKKGTIITCFIVMSIPIFYAYSIPLEDTRYFFILYPLFTIISLFTINKFQNYFKNENKVLIIIICGIVLSSMIFMQSKSIENEYENEVFQISQKLIESKIGINEYSPESRYLEVSNILKDKSIFESYFLKDRTNDVSIKEKITQNLVSIPITDYSSLIDFIIENEKKGLTHIVVDNNPNRELFLKHVFENESKYEYLIKEFDSKDEGFSYHLKLFKINFDILKTKVISTG